MRWKKVIFYSVIGFCYISCQPPIYISVDTRQIVHDLYKTDSISIIIQVKPWSFTRIDRDSLSTSIQITLSAKNNSSSKLCIATDEMMVFIYDKMKQSQGVCIDNYSELIIQEHSQISFTYHFSFIYSSKNKYTRKHGIKVQIPHIVVNDSVINLTEAEFILK